MTKKKLKLDFTGWCFGSEFDAAIQPTISVWDGKTHHELQCHSLEIDLASLLNKVGQKIAQAAVRDFLQSFEEHSDGISAELTSKGFQFTPWDGEKVQTMNRDVTLSFEGMGIAGDNLAEVKANISKWRLWLDEEERWAEEYYE